MQKKQLYIIRTFAFTQYICETRYYVLHNSGIFGQIVRLIYARMWDTSWKYIRISK